MKEKLTASPDLTHDNFPLLGTVLVKNGFGILEAEQNIERVFLITVEMVSDSIPTPMASDFVKKKRANRSAKLKQCKLYARRDQWLSQGSSSSCNGICSASLSEEDDHRDDDDDCIDDWEAIADALDATDQKLEQHHPGSDSFLERDESLHLTSQVDVSNRVTENDTTNNKSEYRGLTSRPPVCYKAWRPDDAFRPQILPNLSKQYSFPMNSERHCSGGAVFGCQRLSVPTSCPICCEDLDFTDTSFLRCTCSFVLCLFCHKKILEEDGRCPGCGRSTTMSLLRVRQL
uniref:Anti-virus transcriptional factor n=1 Tax=Solanum tuberosum TaxID=4113 RepID=M1AUX4_SOLTU